MNDIEFLKCLCIDLQIAGWDSEAVERLMKIIRRFENLVTLEQGYNVFEDTSREAHDHYKDKSS